MSCWSIETPLFTSNNNRERREALRSCFSSGPHCPTLLLRHPLVLFYAVECSPPPTVVQVLTHFCTCVHVLPEKIVFCSSTVIVGTIKHLGVVAPCSAVLHRTTRLGRSCRGPRTVQSDAARCGVGRVGHAASEATPALPTVSSLVCY
jgi:hypothetical protein